jgi:Ca2+-binding EF-hand superfamily protein
MDQGQGRAGYGGDGSLGEFAVNWISFQKVSPEMDANEEVVEKQDMEEGNPVPKKVSCMKRLKSIIFKEKEVELMTTTEKVMELLQPVRYKPSSVEEISRETKFTRSEVKFLYRSFKQECPNGIIDEDRFKEVYENIFPLGDASKYAHLVFQSIDREDTGGITFGDFMEFLSVISKGSTEEKILWSFHFYDADGDGCINKEQMLKVGFIKNC